MSIESEIDRIRQNIANSYVILEALGARMPDVRNSDNLPPTIESLYEVIAANKELIITSDGEGNVLVKINDSEILLANDGNGNITATELAFTDDGEGNVTMEVT